MTRSLSAVQILTRAVLVTLVALYSLLLLFIVSHHAHSTGAPFLLILKVALFDRLLLPPFLLLLATYILYRIASPARQLTLQGEHHLSVRYGTAARTFKNAEGTVRQTLGGVMIQLRGDDLPITIPLVLIDTESFNDSILPRISPEDRAALQTLHHNVRVSEATLRRGAIALRQALVPLLFVGFATPLRIWGTTLGLSFFWALVTLAMPLLWIRIAHGIFSFMQLGKEIKNPTAITTSAGILVFCIYLTLGIFLRQRGVL